MSTRSSLILRRRNVTRLERCAGQRRTYDMARAGLRRGLRQVESAARERESRVRRVINPCRLLE